MVRENPLKIDDLEGYPYFRKPPYIMIYRDGTKPCTPVVHIKIAGIYGCSSPNKLL
jgi:hypothetical protein